MRKKTFFLMVTIRKKVRCLTNINPVLLESNQREKVLPGYYKIMKKIAEISNQNLICNSHASLSAGGKTRSFIKNHH